jgi:probable addiction module antidote protein
VISCYLAEVFQTGGSKLILRAIQNVARAGKMSKIARKAGMSRTSLYWKESASPEFTTVLRVLDAVDVQLVPWRNASTARWNSSGRRTGACTLLSTA